MKKTLSLVLVALLLVAFFAVPAFAAENGTLVLSGAQGSKGETVNLDVNLGSNPGLITMKFTIEWDQGLELVGVTDAGLLRGWTEPSPSISSPYTLRWADSLSEVNNTATGKIATLSFKIKDDALPGDKTVTLASTQSWDANGTKNTIEGATATVKVVCSDHEYDNACDVDCNLCGDIRETAGHAYDDECDSICNNCNDVREAPHVYDGFFDADCNKCGDVREITYDASGTTGDLTWYRKGTHLVITGTGDMPHYTRFGPWGTNYITKVTIEPGVKNIGNRAFYGCVSLETIEIPDTVTSIGATAFMYCRNMKSIEIPDSVKTIGNLAFRECEGLEEVVLPSNLVSVGVDLFYGCISLKSVTIPNTLKVINKFAFAYCISLESIVIPNSVVTLDNSAFRGCTNIKTVTMAASVKNINVDAFNGCTSFSDLYYEGEAADFGKITVKAGNSVLSKVTMHAETCLVNGAVHTYSGETDVDCNDCSRVRYDTYGTEGDLFWYVVDGALTICGEGAMPNYTKFGPWGTAITSVTIKEGVTSIGNRAFYGCVSLETIEIPSTITSVGASSFFYCYSLEAIELPDSVKTIGNLAFRECEGLEEVVLPSNLVSVGVDLFYGCVSLKSVIIPNTLKVINKFAFAYCISLESIVIPNSVVTLDNSAFRGCTNIKTVTMAESVKNINADAFNGCTSFSDLYYEGEAADFGKITVKAGNSVLSKVTMHAETCLVNGAVHTYSGETDVDCNDCSRVRYDTYGTEGDLFWYVVDGALTICGEGAMPNYTKFGPWGTAITSVTIKEGVTSIGNRAFYGCVSLETIEIPSTITSIGASAFFYCHSLQAIELPEGLRTIEKLAFRECKSLKELVIPSTIVTLPADLCYACTSLESITIPSSVKSVGLFSFAYCISLKTVNIPNSVITINNAAFKGCGSITTVVLGSGVQSINADAFNECASLEKIFYAGSESAFGKITVKTGNAPYKDAECSFNYCVVNDGEHSYDDKRDQYCNDCGHDRIEASGKVGDLDWYVIGTELTIYGEGAIPDFASPSLAPWGTSITSVVIEEGVTSIGSRTFIYSGKLTSVTLAKSVTFVGVNAFNSCSALKDVYYSGNEQDFAKITVKGGNTALTGANIHYGA